MTSFHPSQSKRQLDAESAAKTNSWAHQVEIKLDNVSAGERLRRVEAWCADWQIGVRVFENSAPGTVRVAFEQARFARAFLGHFGGVIVPPDQVELAIAADAASEDAFDRIAAERDLED